MGWTGILAKLESICHACRRRGNCVSDIAGVIERIRNSHISRQGDICVARQLRSGEQVLDNEASVERCDVARVWGCQDLTRVIPGRDLNHKFQGVMMPFDTVTL